MIPRLLIDTASVPDGGELRLYRRGGDWQIMLGASELMSSRVSGSEEALATLAAARIAGVAAPRVLIGGLGMGFTLRALLAAAPGTAITVAELVPAVIVWARGPMAVLHGDSLGDPRVTIVEGDVAASIVRGGWDAILLDVDNGPDGLSRSGNDRLYDAAGLRRARAALRPGGVLATWSASADAAFARRLAAAGFDVEEVVARAQRNGGGARHRIWLATRPALEPAAPGVVMDGRRVASAATRETVMAKGQVKNSKEARKPKKEVKKTIAANPSTKGKPASDA